MRTSHKPCLVKYLESLKISKGYQDDDPRRRYLIRIFLYPVNRKRFMEYVVGKGGEALRGEDADIPIIICALDCDGSRFGLSA